MPGDIAQDLSTAVAEFVVASRWNDVPRPVRDHAVRCVFNGVGTAAGGSSDPTIARLVKALTPFSSASTGLVIGLPAKYDVLTAAFLNAAAINVLDFDDTHAGTIIHPTAPVLAVLIALADSRKLSGTELLHAFILGVEVACRLGNAVSPEHYRRGFHITSTCGIFGAAMAAAKVLRLDQRETLWVLGNASAQASGLVATLGSMSKSVGVGGAARNGLMAALLAEGGVEGPKQPLEGKDGFMSVTCSHPDPERVTHGLGEEWEVVRNMIKPYSCGVVLNPVIDACLKARERGAVSPDSIAEIRLRGHPLLKARTDRPSATSARTAQVSAQHAVAVSLVRGAAGPPEFSDEAVADPVVAAMRNKVVAVEADAAMPLESAVVSIVLTNGEKLDLVEPLATGSIGNPMSDDALKRKFVALLEYGCPGLDPQRLGRAIWAIADVDDVGSVLQFARR